MKDHVITGLGSLQEAMFSWYGEPPPAELCDLQSRLPHEMQLFLSDSSDRMRAVCSRCGFVFQTSIAPVYVASGNRSEFIEAMSKLWQEACAVWDDARSWQDWSPEEAW